MYKWLLWPKMTQKWPKNAKKIIKWPILTACRDLYCIFMIYIVICGHIWQLKSERNLWQGSQTWYFYFKMTRNYITIDQMKQKCTGNIQPDVKVHELKDFSWTCWCVSFPRCNLIQTECLNWDNEVNSWESSFPYATKT